MALSANWPSPDNSDVVDRPDMSGFFYWFIKNSSKKQEPILHKSD